MNGLFGTLGPIFGLLVLGYASGRARVLEEAGVRGLVLFAFTFSIPALLLKSMAELVVPEHFDPRFLMAFYGASAVVYALGLGAGRFLFGRSLADQAIFALGASFSNLVLLGIPIVLAALGSESMLPMMLIIGFHSATFMPLTVVLIQSDRSGEEGGGVAVGPVVRDVLTNPIIVGIGLGLIINLVSLTLPAVVIDVLDLLGATAVPCALFAMGASLAGFPIAGDTAPALVLTALKLVVHPTLVWLISVPLLGLEGSWVAVAILLAAMPCGVNVYLFGARYDAAAQVAARTVLLTTAGSVVSVSAVLAWL